MIAGEADLQFKDYLFIHRLNLSTHSRNNHSTVPYLRISRSTWTKKVKRQKQNERKLESLQNFFQDSNTQNTNNLTQSYRTSTQARTIHINEDIHPKFTTPNTTPKIPKSRCNQSPINTHFSLSKNLYGNASPTELSNSGILF